MEKAEELIRQAVKNSSVENTDISPASDNINISSVSSCLTQNSVKSETVVNPPDCDSCKTIDGSKDTKTVTSQSTSDNDVASNVENNVNKSKCGSSNSSDSLQDLASPEKRGVKR